MTINNIVQPKFSAIAVGDDIYKVECVDGEYLSVFKGKIGIPFEMLDVKGESPVNRDLFSLTVIDDDSFLLTGGICPSILEFDIWRFNISKNSWTKLTNCGQRVPCRKGHCSILWYYAGCSRLYVIGGASFVYLRKDILCIEFNGDTFTATSIPLEADGLPPRVFCSVSLIQNRLRVFGGLDENGKILGDLWDLSATYHNPAVMWTPKNHLSGHNSKSIEKMGRYNHISYVVDDHVYIVGGIGRNGPLNNVAAPWEIKNIYEAEEPVIYSNKGLVEVCDPPKLVELNSIYTQMDILFDDLRQKETLYTQTIELKKHLRQQRIEEQKLISQEFSEEFFNEVMASKMEERDILMDELSQSLVELTNFQFSGRESNGNGIKAIICFFEYQLRKKKKIHEAKYNLLKKEIEIATEKLNKMPQVEIIKYDTGNYDSIWKIIEPMNNSDRSAILDQYITRQLLDLAELRDKCARYKQKKHKDMQSCIRIISKTAENASETLVEAKKSHQRWYDRLDALQKDLLDAESFNGAIQKGLDRNVVSRLFEARWKLRDELEKLCDHTAELNEIYDRVKKLKADEQREGRTAIIDAMPELLSLCKTLE
ncbi:Kelch motif family protein [Trichomonas vaginalis G3]|uniref:Kelch motif family protein n=1 Tax=Trichomonas vaginalis (strain ATCC PRA-98 / G3) TaxID=412133 RepID=A2E1N8_TRIV3|nr:Kelch-type beta propeller family [Trichomonas vaginalis G3]EAY13485.1 Kelch motif family protein [Trichomonas vaginalis G3]KAI5518055.1 Kelch-type beta propeller family [Trichomonas vaginalis G3]|eukprot:XP_001325708.1 Kelch motif family protein [Trichomonas vaginalis G3]